MTQYGIRTSDTDLKSGELTYDSTLKKVNISLKSTPKHVDVVKLNAGTIITGTNAGFEEEIFRVDHGIKDFVPEVDCFFYVTSAPSDRQTGVEVGTYQKNRLLMIYNAIGYGTEEIEIKVDSKSLVVIHKVSSQSSSFQGNGNLVKFNMKYMIYNMKRIVAKASQ